MKKLFLSFCLLVILFACNENKQEKKESEIEVKETSSAKNLKQFYIEIRANSDEDLAETDFSKLVLSYQGKVNQKKLEREFKDNKVIFEGEADPYDEIFIEYKYNVDNILYMKTGIGLVVEDTIVVDYNFSISEIDLGDEIDLVPQFDDQTIKQGKVNKQKNKMWSKLYDGLENLSYSWDILDSLNQAVFPDRRAQLFENYKKYINNSEHEILKAKYFSTLVNSTEFKKAEWLTLDDHQQLHLFFNQIDTALSDNCSYKTAENKLYSFTVQEGQLFDFKDFETKTLNGETTMVSDFFEKDKINIIYYWTSWCGPCHRFIQDFKDNYEKYEANDNYNLIFVNMDWQLKHWERTSNEYQIKWSNLYIGYDEDLMNYYQFRGFPSKFAYGNNNEKLEFDFEVIEDLLKN